MRRTSSPPDTAPQSALARLLEVESRLEAMLDEARLESEATLKDAEERADLRTKSLATELAAADAELSARLTANVERRIAEEEAVLAAARARYEAIGDAAIEAHARWIVAQVLGIAAEGAS
jgi:hypothetical protein